MKGLTIIETLVYISIFALAIGVISGFIIHLYRSNAYTIEQAYAVNSARKGVEIMTREIREATYSDTGAYPVISSAPQSFSFYSDIDKDKNIEKVRYFLDGYNLKKGVTKAIGDPPEYNNANEDINIISDNVRNGDMHVFTYYNASSTEVTDLSNLTDIRLVKVNIIVNIDPARPPEEFTLRSSSQIRNLYEY